MVKLDKEKLNKRITKFVDTPTALDKVLPMEWPQEVMDGEKIVIANSLKTEKAECVKLGILL